MQRESIKAVVAYYKNIPELLKYEYQEREKIIDVYYNGLKSAGVGDGMPHGTGEGKPTEKMGIEAAKKRASEAIRQSYDKIKLLESDEKIIHDCIECMNGKYKMLIYSKLVNEYSWVQLSVKLERPESTIRYWLDLALDRLGEILEEDVKELDVLVKRASRAR